MSLITKRILGTALAFTLLFATIVRAPGVMLVHDGTHVTFEICTGDGVEFVSMPTEDRDSEGRHLDCEFFSAQIAALLGGSVAAPVQLADVGTVHRLPYRDLVLKRLAQNSYLTRGPPVPS